MNNYYSHSRSEILPFVPPSLKFVLDVGCASGNFGYGLKKMYGCTVWGVEPDISAATLAKEKLDNVIIAPFTEELGFHGQKFDAIFFNDVLEHLVDPAGALKVAKEHLTKEGFIIASIPNILHYETIANIIKTRDWKYEEAGIMDKTHLRFFSKKSVVRLFEQAGLQVELVEGLNPSYGQLFRYFNFLLFKKFDEMKYIQFLVKATKA